MSDPVINAEIEDVLSSIRRLVAEEERPAAAPPPVASDKLVLTPALRVMEAEAPVEEPSGEAAEPDTDASEQPALSPVEDAADDLPAPELVEGHELAGLDLDDTAKRNLEARIAELEAVISDTGGQWEQDGEEGSDNAGTQVQSLSWDAEDTEAEAEPAKDRQSELAADEPTDADEADMAEDVAEVSDADDRVTAMPFLRHSFSVPDDETPDAVVAEASEPEAEEPEPEIAAQATSTPEPQDLDMDLGTTKSQPLPETELSEQPYEGQDFVVDEEALRALVVEIVHQELQGTMGERITRNVRNLVRREIHRAMTSQELE